MENRFLRFVADGFALELVSAVGQMTEVSDQILLAAARSGDKEALETLLSRYQARVYRFGMKVRLMSGRVRLLAAYSADLPQHTIAPST